MKQSLTRRSRYCLEIRQTTCQEPVVGVSAAIRADDLPDCIQPLDDPHKVSRISVGEMPAAPQEVRELVTSPEDGSGLVAGSRGYGWPQHLALALMIGKA
jgi:hypothetical protein